MATKTLSIMDTYRQEVETFERDAIAVSGVEREMLAVCAGRFADRMTSAAWSSRSARADGEALAGRARAVERALLDAIAEAA